MTDLKFTVRQLLNNPVFTAVAILTLALGIGATTALFSVMYGVVVSPYPYVRPGEIWAPGFSTANFSAAMRPYEVRQYLEMAELPGFADTMATSPDQMLLTGDFAPQMLETVRVSTNAPNFLGVPPILGRSIGPGDIRASGEAEPVAVISYGLWYRLFGGRPDALGQSLRLNDQPYAVIGVMPPRFGWWTNQGVWLPLGLDQPTRNVFPIARLAPGVTQPVAEQQLHALHQHFVEETPGWAPSEFRSTLTNYLDITVASGTMERSLQLLFGAVGFLLLIACANVAGLQLARGSSRGRELAVRLALGAQRRRIVRQLLTESVLLAGAGGVLGLGFAFAITRLMVTLMPSFLVPNESRIEVNGFVLLFCAVTAVLTGILFGLVPALHSSRANLTDALKDSSSGSNVTAGSRSRAVLVVAEVALCVVLLVSAGMTVRAFISLQQVELGFRPEQVMTANLTLPPNRYATPESRNRFAAEVLEAARNLPGVMSASIGNGGLPFGGPASSYAIDGEPAPEGRRILLHFASGGYLTTLGIPLRDGRTFDAIEIADARPVALINETAVALWAQGVSPIGREIHVNELGRLNPNGSQQVTVIGVFADARNTGLDNDAAPAVLLPYTLIAPPNRTLAIRTPLEPGTVMTALRARVAQIDREVPLGGPGTLFDAIETQSIQPRFTMSLFSLFAALGLALAMTGIYGVLSYLVVRRTREIGLRMALGAGRREVLGMFMRHGGRLVAIGFGVGIVISLGVARLLTSRIDLFQVSAFDPISIAAMALILGAVATVACYVPARRATRVDPMIALRRD